MNIKMLLIMLLFLVSPALAQDEISDSPEALLGLAESLISKQQYREAKQAAHEVLEISPGNIRAKWILAKASLTLGEFREAQAQADDLLKAAPNDPDYQTLQGMIHMLQKEGSKAIPFLEKALRLGPGQRSPAQIASYANTLVIAQHGTGNSKKALEVCLQALKDYPQDSNLYLTCSRIYREAKNFQAALDIAKSGLQVTPDFPNLHASVALAEAGLGNRQRSEQAYQELQKLSPELAKELRPVLDGLRQDDAEYRVRVD